MKNPVKMFEQLEKGRADEKVNNQVDIAVDETSEDYDDEDGDKYVFIHRIFLYVSVIVIIREYMLDKKGKNM